jgi:hypothetical protein
LTAYNAAVAVASPKMRPKYRLLSWLRQANEGEGGGITPIARFRMQLQVNNRPIDVADDQPLSVKLYPEPYCYFQVELLL